MELRAILTALVMPVTLQLILLVLGFLLWRIRRGVALLLIGVGVVSLWLLSTGAVTGWLIAQWERFPPLAPDQLEVLAADANTAIVILGGGRASAPEYPAGEQLAPVALMRIRYGAFLQRETGLPILVSGGSVFGEAQTEADLMMQALDEFGAEVRWPEAQSRTTWENAARSADMLASAGIGRVVLVTDALHMRRSVFAFEAFGLEVVPAPTYWRGNAATPTRFLPSAGTLQSSRSWLHEVIGLAWYRARY